MCMKRGDLGIRSYPDDMKIEGIVPIVAPDRCNISDERECR